VKDQADRLREEVDAAVRVLRQMTEGDAAREIKPGGWQVKEVLGHLVDSAYNNHQRFVRAPRTPRFVWPGYDQDVWVAANGYRARPWAETVELWAAANLHLAHAIERVSTASLGIECEIGGETGTLEWWIRDYIVHLRHHLAQITSSR
jgi:DinB superfamily